jgi:hypothetical protein
MPIVTFHGAAQVSIKCGHNAHDDANGKRVAGSERAIQSSSIYTLSKSIFSFFFE